MNTIAGSAGVSGYQDGDAAHARFNFPWSLVCDALNNIYIADEINHCIRKMNVDSGKSVSIALYYL